MNGYLEDYVLWQIVPLNLNDMGLRLACVNMMKDLVGFPSNNSVGLLNSLMLTMDSLPYT